MKESGERSKEEKKKGMHIQWTITIALQMCLSRKSRIYSILKNAKTPACYHYTP